MEEGHGNGDGNGAVRVRKVLSFQTPLGNPSKSTRGGNAFSCPRFSSRCLLRSRSLVGSRPLLFFPSRTRILNPIHRKREGDGNRGGDDGDDGRLSVLFLLPESGSGSGPDSGLCRLLLFHLTFLLEITS